jgi:serine/threonine-protein kinase
VTGAADRGGWKIEWAGDSWTVPGYIDLKKLGKGGSGRVVIARHAATGRNVAIKYLNEELCSKAKFRTALRTEARLLSGLTSPHVTRLYEYVEAEHGAAIVMELVYGAALRALLKKEGHTHPEAALVVLKGSLLGLAAAHGVGVVHRDYKPENVLVNWDGRTKLVDFGIAARAGDAHDHCGTCAYMPPEQWRMEAATPAGDVYAATVTLYECLTGVRPFEGPEPWDFLRQHVEEPVPMDPVPEEVRGLVRHGMAKDPALRPPSALDFLRELEWVAENAYGSDWEERGQSRLAAVAAALVPAAISRLDARLVGSSAELADTVLTARRRGRLRVRGDVLTGAAAVAVAGLLSLTPGGWAGGAEAHAGAHTQAVTSLDAPEDSGSAKGTRDTERGRTAGSVSESDRAGTSGAQGSGGGDSGVAVAPADDDARADAGSGGGAGDSGTNSRNRPSDTGPGTDRSGGQGNTATNTDGGAGPEDGTSTGETETETETHGSEDTGTRADPDHTHENTGSENGTDRRDTDSRDDGNTGVGNAGTGNTGTGQVGGDGGGDSRTGTAGDAGSGPGSGQGGTGTAGNTDRDARHGHSGAGTGSESGAGGGTAPDKSGGSGGDTSAGAGAQASPGFSSSAQSQSATSQSSTDSGNPAVGAGTGSASTQAVTPRQGVPAAVEGEPG